MSAYGLTTNTIVPLRREPDDRSEMESQLLFGEHFRIVDKHYQWRKIRNAYDGYEGWIDEKTFEPVSRETYDKLSSATAFYVADVFSSFQREDGSVQLLVPGARLPDYDPEKKTFVINGKTYAFSGEVLTGRQPDDVFFRMAERYRNAPYLWGGMTPFGIDCSGLTQTVFKITGRYRLPRNASQQAQHGLRVDFADRQPGDLAFFVNEKGKIHHVGLVWFEGQILHAHGRVRLDELLPEGIYNRERDEITHTLVLIRRI